MQAAVAEQRRRCQMHHVGVESAQHADHPGPRHTERQRGDLGEHPRRHPVHPDAVVHLVGGRLTARGVRGDDESFVTGAAEMLDHPKHRVGDAVDIREERLCDDCNAHAKIVSSESVVKVAARKMSRENLVRPTGRCEAVASIVPPEKGRLTCGSPGPWRRWRSPWRSPPWRCTNQVAGDRAARPRPSLRWGSATTGTASSQASTTPRCDDRDLHRTAVQPLRGLQHDFGDQSPTTSPSGSSMSPTGQ